MFYMDTEAQCYDQKKKRITSTMKHEKAYSNLDSILKNEINNECVKIDERKKTEYSAIAIGIVNEVVEKLCQKDETFKTLYSRLGFVGSYYDGLRIKEATEFDLNLIMKLPLHYPSIDISNMNAAAGFVKVNISQAKNYPHYNGKSERVIDKWCDDDGYLQQNQVRSWLEGCLTKCLLDVTTIHWGGQSFKIKYRKSGPAFTLEIFHEDVRIDVDLVFTLEFPETRRPPSSIRWNNQLARPWIVVPKPLERHPDKNILWRISFPLSEKVLISPNCLNHLKFVNKLMKALRDSLKMNIASYYIKSVFLWEAHFVNEGSQEPTFWEKNRGYLFVYALKLIQVYLQEKKLPYYWHKKLNLFESLNPCTLNNNANRLGRIIKEIENLLDKKEELCNYMFNVFGVHQEAASQQSYCVVS